MNTSFTCDLKIDLSRFQTLNSFDKVQQLEFNISYIYFRYN